MKIREIHYEDKDALIELVAMMLRNSNKKEVASKIVDDFYLSKSFITFVCETDENVIGFLSYKLNPFEGANKVGEIVFLGVDLNFRKKGYGHELALFIENSVQNMGVRKIYVKTSPCNTQAVCFWIKQGYEFESRMKDFNSNNHDAYFMGKKLDMRL